MYFLALATDYDGTLAADGRVDAPTMAALRRFKASGRRIILVTGREIRDLQAVMPDLSIFDRVVAENGALLFDPATGADRLLGEPIPAAFADGLRALGVAPLSVGRVVVATWEPHEATVLQAIRTMGLELQIVFNKGAVMVLPPGVSKASGLRAALAEFGLSPHNVVGVGDAENDHSFLSVCGGSAAVANALPMLKSEVDCVLAGDHGAGVTQLIDRILDEDAALAPVAKHGIAIGEDAAGETAFLTPYGGHVLIVGPSGCGKSTLATTLTEQMVARDFAFCALDPEGDYYELDHAVCVGSAATPPDIEDALKLHQENGVNLVINTQALTLGGRRRLFARLAVQAAALRAATGRPHWLVVDEAHEVLPAERAGPPPALPVAGPAAIFVTLDPEALDADVLRSVAVVLAFGDGPAALLAAFARTIGQALPPDLPVPGRGEVLCWRPGGTERPLILRPIKPKQRHHRHVGKYATGDVGAWRSFYFRGPDDRLNLPARNLYDFIEVAEALDAATWTHHLRAGDYSAWFEAVIRDGGLARDARAIEGNPALNADESRRMMRKAIWRRYAAPCRRHAPPDAA
jgi:hydroxymethylpyrimidine pyrophosphatase-like HAD family hydrolase/GTPase SAR1 family protein